MTAFYSASDQSTPSRLTGRGARRGLGAAGRLRPAAQPPLRPGAGRAGAVRAGRADLVRHEQHPLHDRDPHRELGPGQVLPLRAGHARPASRSCGTSARRPGPTSGTPRGTAGAAAGRRAFPAGVAPSRSTWASRRATRPGWPGCCGTRGLADGPVGVDVVELPVLRALEREGLRVEDGHGLMQDVRVDQDSGRDRAAGSRGRPGRRGLRGAVPASCGPASGRTTVWRWSTSTCTRTGRRRWRRSTPSPASGAARTRTCSPTG